MFFNAILLVAGLGWYTMISNPPAPAAAANATAEKAAPAKAAPAKAPSAKAPAKASARAPLVAWGEAPKQD
jgi:hypothetical protein